MPLRVQSLLYLIVHVSNLSMRGEYVCVLLVIYSMTAFGAKWLSGPADFNTITKELAEQHFEILFSPEYSSGVELPCYSLIVQLFSLR